MVYATRLATFQTNLAEQADIAFFPISSDLHYLTGVPRDIPNFGRVIHPGEWVEGIWIAPNNAPILTLPRMTVEFGGRTIEDVEVRMLGDFDDTMTFVGDILTGFNLPAKPRIALGDSCGSQTVAHLHRLYPDATFVSATDILRPQRMIKDEAEIELMRQAGEITESAFQAVLRQLRIGMTELDIVSEVDFQLRKHGSLGPSFTTTLYNSGPNMPMSFNRMETWHRRLRPPCSVLFDFGAIHEGYCYDFGRTVSFGEPKAEFRLVHSLIMQSQAQGIAAMKAGEVTAGEVDAAARDVIAGSGYGEQFRHRLGHSIGLDVHEPPFLTKIDDTVLQNGMMFTVEPSIIQNQGFSARVEDVVVIRDGVGERLTTGFQELYVVD